jgi:hypothetical protein
MAPPGEAMVLMTKPLRRIHAAIWLALPILLFTIFVASLVARRTTTPMNPALHWESLP